MQFIQSLLYKAFCALCLVTCLQPVWSQSFGGLPPNIDWKQINTDTVRIIFPENLEQQALRLANAVHYLHQNAQDDIGDRTHKIDILINNQSTIANGTVSIAPWKSHLLTTPFQDNFALTSMPWLDLLAIHEYRHVTQMSTARRGIVKILSYLFGQESWAGGANLSIPNWFTEGDAVWAETHFSNQGRGRVAHFLQGYRALNNRGQHYSYAKARNGSLKDYVPDHYRLGYLMLKYGHQHFGESFWKDILIESASYQGLLYPFSNAIKRKTGMGAKGLYGTMLDAYAEEWDQHAESSVKEVLLPATDARTFSDYLHPYPDHIDSSLVYYKRTYDHIGAFYKYNFSSGNEEHLFTRGISLEPYFGYSNGLITWTELTTDPRWQERNYSDIITYDTRSKIRKRITRKKRYFSPQADFTASRIICTAVDHKGVSTLQVLDARSGEIIKSYEHPGWFYTFPKWSRDNQEIIASVRGSDGKMGIIGVDLDSGEEREIVPFRNRILGIPSVSDNEVFYSASTNDVENIFATHLITRSTRKVTQEANGAFQPAVGLDRLYYTTFTHLGHVIKRVETHHSAATEEAATYEFEVKKNVLDSFPSKKYNVTKYRKWAHSLNLHTWGLDFDDPEIFARVLSNNVLNNVELSAGISYNYDQQVYRPYAEARLATFYPTLALRASTIKRSAVIEDMDRHWREVNLFAGAFVDYNLMSGRFQRTLTPLIGYNRTGLSGDIDTSINSLLAQITFIQQQMQARKNIFTHNGQYLQLRYSRAVDKFEAGQLQLRSGLAFRGIGVNHNLLLEADLKADLKEAQYQFSSGLNHRGYGIIQAEKLVRLAADYHFPLLYPDWGLAGLVYLYRIRADLFFEHTNVLRNVEGTRIYNSLGAEMVFDVNLVNEVATSFGFRYSYPLDKDTAPTFEFFIPVYRF